MCSNFVIFRLLFLMHYLRYICTVNSIIFFFTRNLLFIFIFYLLYILYTYILIFFFIKYVYASHRFCTSGSFDQLIGFIRVNKVIIIIIIIITSNPPTKVYYSTTPLTTRQPVKRASFTAKPFDIDVSSPTVTNYGYTYYDYTKSSRPEATLIPPSLPQ